MRHLTSDSSRAPGSPTDPWLLLRTLALFRLLANCLFVAAPILLGNVYLFARVGDHYSQTAWLYLIAGSALALLRWRRQPGLEAQVALQVFTDIVFVTLLMREAGGVESGIGILLCVSVSATAMLRSVALSYLFAALAASAVLTLTFYLNMLGGMHSYPQAVALGTTYFLVAVLSAHFSRHRLATQAVIAQQQQRLADLQALSAEILRQFEHGLLAVESDGEIAILNPRAADLLATGPHARGSALAVISPALWELVSAHRRDGTIDLADERVYAQIKQLSNGMKLLTLFSEQAREAEAQTRKMATLGQWTASVAHEIRNPLSAISQAAELMEEQEDITPVQRRLADIVTRNSRRIDSVVTDILNLARPPRSLETLVLLPWVRSVVEDLQETMIKPPHRVTLHGDHQLKVALDPEKMRHVLENLCRNSLEHGGQKDMLIEIKVGLDTAGRPRMTVGDNGSGVPQALRERLFEPFASGRGGGTGLGLFIAREITEQQGISLRLLPGRGGARFELGFPLPDSRALAA